MVYAYLQPDLRAPDRQAFATLGSGGKISVVSRLVELCPTGTFGQPGLYLLHAQASTRPIAAMTTGSTPSWVAWC